MLTAIDFLTLYGSIIEATRAVDMGKRFGYIRAPFAGFRFVKERDWEAEAKMKMQHVFEIEVRFEKREDGGLRAYSPDVPLFVLSHSKAERVLSSVVPVLECMLSHRAGAKVTVARLSRLSESASDEASASLGPQRFASLQAAA